MLSSKQREILKGHHFTSEEIDKLNKDLIDRKQVLNLDTGVWQSILRRREKWYGAQKKKGISITRIKKKIRAWYKASDANTIWALLRAEYIPPSKIESLAEALIRRRETEERMSDRKREAVGQARGLYSPMRRRKK